MPEKLIMGAWYELRDQNPDIFKHVESTLDEREVQDQRLISRHDGRKIQKGNTLNVQITVGPRQGISLEYGFRLLMNSYSNDGYNPEEIGYNRACTLREYYQPRGEDYVHLKREGSGNYFVGVDVVNGKMVRVKLDSRFKENPFKKEFGGMLKQATSEKMVDIMIEAYLRRGD